jgi:hypothetical protein
MVHLMCQETAGNFSLHWRRIQRICRKQESLFKVINHIHVIESVNYLETHATNG